MITAWSKSDLVAFFEGIQFGGLKIVGFLWKEQMI